MTPEDITVENMKWGEREGVTLELLEKFTKPGDARFGDVMRLWHYRGDLTEVGDGRLRRVVGEAYEHWHWDTVACTGGILVVVPRWYVQGVLQGDVPLSADYWWAMKAVGGETDWGSAQVRAATEEEISAVVPESRERLAELPGLEYMHVEKVSHQCTFKPGERVWRSDPAPSDVRFFRFAAGYGCVRIAG